MRPGPRIRDQPHNDIHEPALTAIRVGATKEKSERFLKNVKIFVKNVKMCENDVGMACGQLPSEITMQKLAKFWT